ncbi:MAG: D-tyrosyl-tRNA(Tyr) deacylase [Chloroflexi bacterium]|nr:D-tyrosyl-tRNA(Tyr) deacylase [Chloroflexota bacterium]
MRALIQRVTHAAVQVDGQAIGRIGHGLAILLGVTHADGHQQAERLAEKTAGLRIFSDAAGKMNLSVLDVQGDALVISQFTLYANNQRGRRPDFLSAARPEQAAPLVERFVSVLGEAGVKNVQTGVFGAHMLVEIFNDGPVTIMLDTDDWA